MENYYKLCHRFLYIFIDLLVGIRMKCFGNIKREKAELLHRIFVFNTNSMDMKKI